VQIIIVGDDQPLRVQLARAVGAGRFDVVCAVPGVDQVPQIGGRDPLAALLAHRTAASSQQEAARLRDRFGDRLTVIVVATQPDPAYAALVIDGIADDFVAWTHGPTFLAARLEALARRRSVTRTSPFIAAVASPLSNPGPVTGRAARPVALQATETPGDLLRQIMSGGRDHAFIWDLQSGGVTWPFEADPQAADLPPTRAAWDARVHGDDIPPREVALDAHLVAGTAYAVAVRVRVDGMWRTMLERGALVGSRQAGRFVGLLTDIEDDVQADVERRAEQQRAQLSDAAGALAEDLNASLLGAFTNLDAVIDAASPGRMKSDLDEARHALQGAFDWTRRLLALGRRQPPQPEYVSLQDVVQDLVDRLARQLGSQIQLVVESRESPGVVLADPMQLETVLSILCDRAAKAMPHGGRVTINLAPSNLRDEAGVLPTRALDGRWARLRVIDMGPPLPAGMINGHFDPLAHGLGDNLRIAVALATVRAIVTQHDGFIRGVNLPEDGGSAFEVYLPVVTRPPARLRRPESGMTTPVGGGELILVCDDDELVLRMIEKLLRTAGYQVLTASDGDQGVLLFERYRRQIKLCVFDIVMPVMGGRVASERVRALEPVVPCLFMSGYTMSIQDTEFVQDPSRKFIPKPFNAGQLLREVRAALEGR